MTEPSRAVFLSYASQDAEAARRICEALRAAGIEVWFDRSELRGGDVWDRQIRKQIHDCALFVPIISANTQARPEGYFRLEWKLAVERTHLMSERVAFLVPLIIDDTRDAEADVPDKFREVQWMRLPKGEASPDFVERVSRLLSHHESPASDRAPLSAGAPPRPAAASGEVMRNPGAPWRSRAALLLIAGAAVIGGGYFAVDKFILSKRPAAGTQTAASVVGSVEPTPNTIPEKSIAVLPFVDMSEKKDQEYFADGMAEEIINLLVKIPELKVIGRTSSFQFKGKTDDLRKIGTALGTAFVVEGSVRRSGDQIRVTAQLIDTRNGTHRWSDTYDRDVSDVLKVQGEIAAGLVRALQLEVTSFSHLQGRALPKNSEVYDTYLRGLHALNRFDQPGFDEAVADFKRALAIDPLFVPAAEQLARTLCDYPTWGFVPPKIGFEQARVAANAALKLDSKSAIAHAILGCVHVWYDWNWPAAQQELRTAVTLAPNEPIVLAFAAMEPMAVGQWIEALHLCEAATTADPLFAAVYQISGWAYVRLGRLAEAERANRRMLQISPTFAQGHHDLGIVLLMEGKPEAALAEMQKETPVGGQSAGLAVVYHALRRVKEADMELKRLETEHSGDMATWIAEAYAFRGQKDQAFTWLDRAYAQKDINLWLIKGDPLLKNLEGDPRYKAFLGKMNLP